MWVWNFVPRGGILGYSVEIHGFRLKTHYIHCFCRSVVELLNQMFYHSTALLFYRFTALSLYRFTAFQILVRRALVWPVL